MRTRSMLVLWLMEGEGLPIMSNTLYRIAFKDVTMEPQEICAAAVQIHGEHLIFLDAGGKLVALFYLEVVESWSRFQSEVE